MQWMFLPLKRYADFQGRSSRKEFWMYALFVAAVVIVLDIIMTMMLAAALASADPATGMVSGGIGLTLVWLIMMGFILATFIPSLAVAVRRMHDQDKSGWFILIPIYNLVLYCMPGTPGQNRFGPNPLGGAANAGQTFQ